MTHSTDEEMMFMLSCGQQAGPGIAITEAGQTSLHSAGDAALTTVTGRRPLQARGRSADRERVSVCGEKEATRRQLSGRGNQVTRLRRRA